MLKRIFNINKLFQRHKPEAQVSMSTVHGTRCILHVANLALLGVVIMLTITSALIYYLIPVADISELSEMVEIQDVETIFDADSVDVDSKKEELIANEDFSVISEKNVFSHERKEWVVKVVIPKASELEKKKHAKKALAKKKAMAGKPKKIVLHGIVMSGDIKKALINNPSKGVSKKKTVYVEEGDELEGYKVTSIEKDRIKLDWHGEEIVVPLYSGLKDFKQGSSAGKIKSGGITKFDYKFDITEDVQAEESFDVSKANVKKVAYADIFEETSSFSMYKKPDHFFTPAPGDRQVSGLAEKQGVAEILPDIELNDVDSSEKEQKVVTKFDYTFNIIEDIQTEERCNVNDSTVKKVAHANMLDETSLSHMYEGPEYFFKPTLGDVPKSGLSEKQEVAEILPDIKLNVVDSSEVEQKVVKADMSKSADFAVEGVLKQKALSVKPTGIVLHGIVIVPARDIKKALVNIPMSDLFKKRTLYVEEGDGLEGYKVTSIEPDRLRLDWHGKEIVVEFPPL